MIKNNNNLNKNKAWVKNNYRRTSAKGHLSTTATFLADSPYIDSYLNFSTTATLFCPHGGRCGEVQLYLVSLHLSPHRLFS